MVVRGEPEHGLERYVPVEAPIVSEDKLVEVGVDVLAAQPVTPAARSTETKWPQPCFTASFVA